MMDVFSNMGVILLNFFSVVIYIALALILVFGPVAVGLSWWIMINVWVSERPKLRKRSILWNTLGVIFGALAALFIYSVIITTMNKNFWAGPALFGDIWLGGLR